jgi:hypothetical protein
MGRTDEVDIVASGGLEFEHQFGQHLRRIGRPGVLLADVAILAKNAMQVAAAKEQGARAARAAQNLLFAEVGKGAGHFRVAPDAAKARLVMEAVNSAMPRTGLATAEHLDRPLGAIP